MVQADLEFVYVGDPMCSWCWGFAPVLERLEANFDIPLRTVVGGLRPGVDAQMLDARLRDVLLEHWEHVAAASGQPFDRTQLDDRVGVWSYDTEPSCRAVVAMRTIAPEHTLRFFARIQRAFYAEAVDVTDLDVFPALLGDLEVDVARFASELRSEDNRARTWRDFATSRRWGISGFPSLLLREGESLHVVARGYLGWDQLEPALTGWLRDRYGSGTVDDLVCAVDGDPC